MDLGGLLLRFDIEAHMIAHLASHVELYQKHSQKWIHIIKWRTIEMIQSYSMK